MIDGKHINKVIIAFMLVAVAFAGGLTVYARDYSAPAAIPEYAGKVFDRDKVTGIDIEIKEEDFDWLLENATREEYRSCDITINGETFHNVGIRPKGNSSLHMVAGDDSTQRFSFKIEFDTYVDGQSCFGLNKLALNNIIMDKTYMKEYMGYEMFKAMGVVTPLYSYASININGEPWGLYLAVEVLEESFAQRNFSNAYGNLYKPEGAGADLLWAGESASNYSGIKNGAAYKVTDQDFAKVVDMIDNLNKGTDLEKYLDVDSILRYFAVNTALVNFDSYAGGMKHNYYLYEKDGVFTILPWDLNLAFGGHEISSGEQAVHYPVDKPVTTDLSQRPLIGKLLEVPAYKELYHKYLTDIVQDYFDSGVFADTVREVDALINSYVKNDATAFYTYEEYQQAIPVLLEFGKLRAASMASQLAGERSSTSWEQDDSASDSIDLSALGGMGRGMGGGGRPGDGAGRGNGGFPAGGEGPQAAGGKPGGNERANRGRAQPAVNNGAGGPDMDGNSPERENMDKAMEIIRGAGGELAEEQVAQLKELGFDDAMIERMQNMPGGGQRPGDNGNFGGWGGPGGGNPGGRITPLQTGYIAASAALLLLGLLLASRFKRRKYSS